MLLKDKILLPDWLEEPRTALAGMIGRGQLPQALLLHGSAGMGRRLLALWLAAELLGGELARFVAASEAEDSEQRLAHPDFFLLRPEPDKSTISVERARELIGFLNLRSHRGGARAAVVWSADQLTVPAANCLLKTLEEPPVGSVIVLIAEHLSRLPPTVLSRCHRLALKPPDRAAAVSWLAGQAGNDEWDALLDFCAGAPLAALELHAAGFSRQSAGFDKDLHGIRARRASPVAVARSWVSGDVSLALRWLHRYTCREITQSTMSLSEGSLQKQEEHLNMKRLFTRLRELEYLRRNSAKALNPELQVASLLQAWYGQAPAKGDR